MSDKFNCDEVWCEAGDCNCHEVLIEANEHIEKLEATVKQIQDSMLKHFQEEHLEGDGPEINRWKWRSEHIKAQRDKLLEAAEQLFHNGIHFKCEALPQKPCEIKGGDMMSVCQTCCNKWKMERAISEVKR